MSGLPWFELDVDVGDHPKIIGLSARLGEPLALTYVVHLYAYCYHYARARFDGPGAVTTIEQAARWAGERGVLIGALEAEHLIERHGETLVVHGVEERLAPHRAKRDRDAARMRERRSRVAGTSPRRTRDSSAQSPRGSGDVHRDKDRDKQKDKPLGQQDGGADQSVGGVSRWPGLAKFNDLLAKELARPPLAVVGSRRRDQEAFEAEAIETEVQRLGVEEAVAACAAHAREAGTTPKVLSWFKGFLAELPTPKPRRAAGECPKPGDPDFNEPAAWPSTGAFMARSDGRPPPVVVEEANGSVKYMRAEEARP